MPGRTRTGPPPIERGLPPAGLIACALASLVVYGAPAAAAADRASPFRAELGFEWIVTANFALGSLAFEVGGWIPPSGPRTWANEPVPFDEGLRGTRSLCPDFVSDILLATTLAGPAAPVLFEHAPDETTAQQATIYAETLAVVVFLNGVTKHIVQRPRPYVYTCGADGALLAVKGSERPARTPDSQLSFYSGHSTASFAAAVAGSYLFALTSGDKAARAALWGTEVTLASATAALRVRAGMHFYSDVVVGAVAGIAAGVLVPWLHIANPGVYSPSGVEWAAIGGGLVAGTALAWLMPFSSMSCSERAPCDRYAGTPAVVVGPLWGGAGVSATGAF
jgi:membrane-associated phospholipid phosphatase